MLRRFLARYVNAFSFWAVVLVVAAVMAFAAYLLLPSYPLDRPYGPSPSAGP